MIWQNPWGWLGLLALALPIVIHLLGRGRSRVEQFPTLRFIEVSRLLPTRRTRLQDLALLAIRLSILLAAVAALAQPLLRTATRRRSAGNSLARVVVLDTSRSTQRLISPGVTLFDSALNEARRLTAEASASLVMRSAAPWDALSGAATWLAQQSGRGEIVVLSDFQVGAMDSVAASRIPTAIALRLHRIPVAAASSAIEFRSIRGDAAILARVMVDSGQSLVHWSVSGAAPSSALPVRAAATDREQLEAARAAARSIGTAATLDSTRPVTLLFAGADGLDAVIAKATTISRPWMAQLAARLTSDPLLRDAARDATPRGERVLPGMTLVRSSTGEPLLSLAQATRDSASLLLLANVAANSPFAAAAIAATSGALDGAAAPEESDPRTISDSLLRQWEHSGAAEAAIRVAADPAARDSDGRWFWLAALVLLGLEALVRRTSHVTMPDADVIA